MCSSRDEKLDSLLETKTNLNVSVFIFRENAQLFLHL